MEKVLCRESDLFIITKDDWLHKKFADDFCEIGKKQLMKVYKIKLKSLKMYYSI